MNVATLKQFIIVRIWRGRTPHDRAGEYADRVRLLHAEAGSRGGTVAHRVAAGSAQSADGLLKRTAEMKADVYRRYGGPEVLEYTDVPDPKLSQNSVLVRVRAAALNPADHHDQRVPR